MRTSRGNYESRGVELVAHRDHLRLSGATCGSDGRVTPQTLQFVRSRRLTLDEEVPRSHDVAEVSANGVQVSLAGCT